MMDSVRDLKKTCRACLCTADVHVLLSNRISVCEEEIMLSDIISRCTGMPVSSDDGCPQSLCASCSNDAYIAYRFRVSCVKSAKKLHEELDEIDVKIEMSIDPLEVYSNEDLSFVPSPMEQDSDNSMLNFPNKSETTSPILEKNNFEMNLPAAPQLSTTLSATVPDKYPCNRCNGTFSTSTTLRIHKFRIHKQIGRLPSSKIIICKVCSFKMHSLDMFMEHLVNEHAVGETRVALEKLLTPDICNKFLQDSIEYTKGADVDLVLLEQVGDIVRMTPGGEIKCEICGKFFKFRNALFAHHRKNHARARRGTKQQYKSKENTVHPSEEYKTPSAGKSDKWPCNHCEQIFESRAMVSFHRYRIHNKIRRLSAHKIIICKVCSLKVNSLDLFMNHLADEHAVGETRSTLELLAPKLLIPDIANQFFKDCAEFTKGADADLELLEQVGDIVKMKPEDGEYSCETCGKLYKTQIAAHGHSKRAHGNEQDTVQSSEEYSNEDMSFVPSPIEQHSDNSQLNFPSNSEATLPILENNFEMKLPAVPQLVTTVSAKEITPPILEKNSFEMQLLAVPQLATTLSAKVPCVPSPIEQHSDNSQLNIPSNSETTFPILEKNSFEMQLPAVHQFATTLSAKVPGVPSPIEQHSDNSQLNFPSNSEATLLILEKNNFEMKLPAAPQLATTLSTKVPKKFACHRCNQTFVTSSSLRIHRFRKHKLIRMLAYNKNVICKVCSMKMDSLFNFMYHFATDHAAGETRLSLEKILTPNIYSKFLQDCAKYYPGADAELVLLEKVGDIVKVKPEDDECKCETCGKIFKNQEAVVNHINKWHAKKNTREQDEMKILKYEENPVHPSEGYSSAFPNNSETNLPNLETNVMDQTNVETTFPETPQLVTTMPSEARHKFACEHCSMSYGTRTSLQRHRFIKHKIVRRFSSNRNISCKVCSLKTTSLCSFMRHFPKKHSEGETRVALEKLLITPDGCNTFLQTCARHTKYKDVDIALLEQVGDIVTIRDENEVEYSCEICGKLFKSRKALFGHNMREHENRKDALKEECYKCTYCAFTSNNAKDIDEHRECNHADEKKHCCVTCRKTFFELSQLQQHAEIEHKIKFKKYMCDYCGKGFADKSNLKAHVRLHTGEKPYKCDVCGKGFTQWVGWNYHKDTHEKVRNYICPICGFATINTQALRVHNFRAHRQSRSFKCPTCEKMYKTNSQLQIHIRSVHKNETRFDCATCGKGFYKLFTLKVHERVHTGERPYHCDACGKDFTQSCVLRAHKSKFHPVPVKDSAV